MKAILGIALTLFLATMLIVTFRSTQIVAQKEQNVPPVASSTHSSIEHELAIPLKQGQVNQFYEGQIAREPRSVYVVAVVGVVVTITTAAWTTGRLVQSFNSAVSKLPIPGELKSFLQFYSEKVFERVDEAKLEALEKAPLITKGELVALGFSVLIMTFVFGFVEANGLPVFLYPSVLAVVIPSTLLSVSVVSIAGELSGALCMRTCRIYRQFRLNMYGLGVFLISGLLFLFPFASPGITRYQSGEISSKTKALIVLSKMFMLLTLTIPFAGLFILGFNIVGDAGLLLTLMTVCYSLVPLKPFDGKAVFDYRKEVSVVAFVLAGILFCGCAVNLLPHVTYLAVGVVSLYIATITLSRLRNEHPRVPTRKGMSCNHCGKLVSVEAKFCIYCGKELKTDWECARGENA